MLSNQSQMLLGHMFECVQTPRTNNLLQRRKTLAMLRCSIYIQASK
jgi:hypothetical protein